MESAQLKQTAILKGLDDEALAEVSHLLRPVDYPAGELIFQEGGPCTGLYIILKGFAQYGKLSGRRNRRRILKILGPGDSFGEEGIFSSEVCACIGYARAITDASVTSIEKRIFRDLMEHHPIVARHFSEWITAQLRVFECKLVELAYEPLEQNLIRLLLVLAQRFGVREATGLRIELKFSRQDIADLLGAHLDTVTRELSKLHQKGLVASEGHQLVILNLERLAALATPETTCLAEKLF
jgi:CRP-like cAMP-binding protein